MCSVALDDVVRAFYDARVDDKLRDFTNANPRIEAAIRTIAEWAPPSPKRVLEIGCGIGATTWRMARAWPDATVIGADLSAKSIEVARTCFQLPNLSYQADLVTSESFDVSFDLVVLMDVYEHIALGEREAIHGVLRSVLADESRLIMTVPTPALQDYSRSHSESAFLQPIDEDVTLSDVVRLSRETQARVLYYKEIDVWQRGDYLHVVLGRSVHELADVPPAQEDSGLSALKKRLRALARPTRCAASRPLDVSARERARRALLWTERECG